MTELIEMETVSSRGQIAIPSDIRSEMGIKEGQKVLFFLEGDTLLVKRVSSLSWDEATKPLKQSAKKAKLKKSDISKVISKVRSKKKK